MSAFNLKDKVALVTGGSRGIGKSIAMELAKAGAHVVFTYSSSTVAAENVAKEIQALGVKSIAFQADAVNTARAVEVVEAVVKEFGQLDILVNNAGITQDNLLLRMSEEQWDSVIQTNLKSVYNYSKAAIKPMMRQRKGSIINIASIIGITGNAGQANYAASKAGMIAFSKSLAKELASRNVRVNSVAPGYITTDMTGKLDEKILESIKSATPLGRAGNPEDVANAVIFLASDASAFITGETIKVDGGMAI